MPFLAPAEFAGVPPRQVGVIVGGAAVDGSNPLPTSAGQPTIEAPAAGTITATTTVVAAPGAGRFLRTHYFTWITDPDSLLTPMVTMRSSGGAVKHVAIATAKSWRHDLPEDEGLVLALSSTPTGDGTGYTIYYSIEDL